MKRDVVATLNAIAKEDFDKAEAMLDGINLVLGTKFGWLNRRVVFFDDPDGANRYANCHDAWCWAEE